MSGPKLLPPALIIAITLLVAWCCAKSYLAPNNTLHANGSWTSTKTSLERMPLASISYMVTSPALHRDRLNLAAWEGTQEILYKRRLRPSVVEFDFYLSSTWGGQFNFIFNKSERGFWGFGTMSAAETSGIFFRAGPDGEFLERQPSGEGILRPGQWNHLRAVFYRQSVWISVNDALAVRTRAPALQKQLIGFRGSGGRDRDEILVDNVKILERDSAALIHETFENRRGIGTVLAVIALALLGLNLLLTLLFPRNKRSFFRLVAVNLTILIISASWYLVCFYVYSARYPNEVDISSWSEVRHKAPTEAAVTAAIVRDHATSKRDGHRVLVLGSSQTWGEGATKEQKTLTRVTEQLLNAEEEGEEYVCINAGYRGARSGRLYTLYKESLIKVKPDLLVINLSTNDDQPEAFGANLRRFARLNKKQGIKTLFVLEPNSIPGKQLMAKHEIVRSVAREHDLPFVEMQAFMDLHADDGFLWWDSVHMSDLGQQLFASKLHPEIARILRPDDRAETSSPVSTRSRPQ